MYVAGISYEKEDGECAHPTCKEKINWKKHDKPPSGWAHVVFNRYSKKGGYSQSTFVVCPQHTVGFGDRTPSLRKRATNLIRTVIESPFQGNIEANLRYLRAAMADAFRRQEAPYASHALYTQPGVLDDTKPEERALGMEAGFLWAEAAQKITVYTDLGVSPGMERGIEQHREQGKVIEHRKLSGWFDLRNR